MRVYEIAKSLGIESKSVLSDLRGLGIAVKSASSKVEPICAQAFIAWKREK